MRDEGIERFVWTLWDRKYHLNLYLIIFYVVLSEHCEIERKDGVGKHGNNFAVLSEHCEIESYLYENGELIKIMVLSEHCEIERSLTQIIFTRLERVLSEHCEIESYYIMVIDMILKMSFVWTLWDRKLAGAGLGYYLGGVLSEHCEIERN